ncbi:ACP S-malonyltransferase [Helicobacter anatolicus]|uniref:ACP S-malonyltransferase n=1 Tax=Helicobacter anatolicus TaxID=2905874 RepID=UPI001E3FED7E|nr:ACP S-malonyltransferase [Helicobacter anatolicus]MCE3038945.1 ACP S-malonyltransferase [Helicobacter anatolicus]MCE3040262.1 ACP S-malonyltransferase [Helicobacter anatolicus]
MNYAFIFPGQGSQSISMGKDFYDNFDLARELFEKASNILNIDMKKLCFEENELLNQTQFTQPAIFLVSYIAHTILQQESPILAHLALGHSLGEISAICAANGLKFEDAIALTHKRGMLMQQACEGKDAGMMVIVGLEDSVLENFCAQKREEGMSVWCANYNGEGQIVLAGKKADLAQLESPIKTLGAKRALLLPMSVASHCPLLESINKDFKEIITPILMDNFSLPVISNVTTNPYNTKEEALEVLSNQLTNPVLYKQSIYKIDSEIDAYIEFGHGSVLKGLNKRLSQKETFSISDTTSLKEVLEKLHK